MLLAGAGRIPQRGTETLIGGRKFLQAGDDAAAAGIAERPRSQRRLAPARAVRLQDYPGTLAQFGRNTRAGVARIILARSHGQRMVQRGR